MKSEREDGEQEQEGEREEEREGERHRLLSSSSFNLIWARASRILLFQTLPWLRSDKRV